jgi:hypothetical protein
MVFEYISGEGTDAKSRQRWAQVKAETETALVKMGFGDACALRQRFHPADAWCHEQPAIRALDVRSDGAGFSVPSDQRLADG